MPEARGRVYFDQKNYELAVADFGRALEQRPNDAVLHRRRGEAFYRTNLYDEALADLDRALELDPRSATAHDRRGLVYAAQGRHQEAAGEYAQALKLNPQEPWANLHLVKIYLTIGDDQQSLRCCDAWSDVEPSSGEPERWRGTVYFKSGDYQAALDAFGEALKRDAKDHETYVERGRVYAALGQPAKALADYDKALELNPKYKAVYYSRGLANAELRRYQQAVADFTRALNYSASDGWLYYHRSLSHLRLGRYSQALADASRAVQLGPKEAAFVMLQGRIFTCQNLHEEALQKYLQAFELDPDEAYVRDAIVKAYCAAEDYAAAIEFCDQWIHEQPDTNTPYRYRGFAHYCSGAWDKALADYELALQLDPNDHVCLYSRGQARLALKQREEGCADVQRSIELCPPDKAATHLALVGELYGETEQWDRAQVALAQAVELDALSVNSWYLLALVQLARADQEGYRATCARMLQQFGRTEDPGCAELVARTCSLQQGSGDGDQLLALANQAVEGRPDDPLCRCTLGAVLFRAGDVEEALTYLQEAQRLVGKSGSVPLGSTIPLSYLLAIAHRFQGNEPEAASWLSKAAAASDELVSHRQWSRGEPPVWSWRLVGDVLRREAESMVDTAMTSNHP